VEKAPGRFLEARELGLLSSYFFKSLLSNILGVLYLYGWRR
jgi:hypothetical protein